MTKTDKKFTDISFFLTSFSGISIFILDKFFKVQTEFGLSSHALLDELKLFHHFATTCLVFCLGFIFKSHILPGAKYKKENRKTGLILVYGLLFSAVLGLMLLYSLGPKVRSVVKFIHFYQGLFLSLIYLIHRSKRGLYKGESCGLSKK